MKILITEPEYFPSEKMKELQKMGEVFTGDKLEDADVAIVRVATRIGKKDLEEANNLKLIASMTTTLDHIDVDEAKKRGVEVVSFPGYATTATSEYAMALILSLIRRIPWASNDSREGKWERIRFLGNELSGKTLGIVGFGRIGKNIGKYAQAFGMKIVFFDPYVDKFDEAEKMDSLDELLERSDVVTIHAFLSDETKKMFNRDKISKMKKNAILVNVSRGLLVDESDLIDALKEGKIAGAALDVFEEEPLPSNHKLVAYAKEHDNLILTPHIAGSTEESIQNAASQVIEKIREFATPSNKNIIGQNSGR